MIDTLAGDPILRRRLEAYAEARLSPDAGTTARIRARVLAQAHRQAAIGRTDAALQLVPSGTRRAAGRGAYRAQTGRRAGAALLVAALGALIIGGTALAGRPGGPLYDTRLWVEARTLPDAPSARAVAELDRLTQRLEEAGAAAATGDRGAAAAALAAYSRIVDEASDRAVLNDDPVASAALEAGIARNLTVLGGLLDRLPTPAVPAVGEALARAIERSTAAVERIHETGRGAGGGNGGGGNGNGNGGATSDGGDRGTEVGNGGDGDPASTADPTDTPKPDRTHGGGNGNKPDAAPTPQPRPTHSPKPTRDPK